MAYAALTKAGFGDSSGQTKSETCHGLLDKISDADLMKVVGANSDRSPSWPQGFVGSISHSRMWCLAVAAKLTSYQSIGVDTEMIVPQVTSNSLKADIGRETEWNLLTDAGLEMPFAFTTLFSAKEAFYKCIYPLHKKFVDFLDVFAYRIEPEVYCKIPKQRAGEISIRLIEDEAISLNVRYLITDDDVFTIATM